MGTSRTHGARELGWLRRAWRTVFGERTLLREQEGHTSWLSYLLMIVQSLTLVLIGGSVELRTLLSDAPLPEKALMTLSLAILIFGTVAADMAAQRTMGRIGVLLRNRRTVMAGEHILYVAFVVGVEMATFAIALYVIETTPQALLSGASVLPNSILVIGVMVGIRALIIGWTYVQLKIIAEPLPPNEQTLLRRAVEKGGGHADALLDDLQLRASDLPTVIDAIAEMSKPPRRPPTWWNGWLRRRDEQYEREQDDLRRRQVDALKALGHDDLAAARAEAQRDIDAARAEARRQIETAQRQIETANAASVTRASDALLALLTTGALPDWLTQQRPDLAGVTLESLLARAGGANGGKRGRSGAGASPADTSRAGRQRAFLLGLGIEPSAAPQGKRGVWLRASDVTALTEGKSGSETPQQLVKRLGDGATVGRNLVAPFEPVLRELAERRLLSEETRAWWQAQQRDAAASDADTREDDSGEMDAVTGPNVVRFRA